MRHTTGQSIANIYLDLLNKVLEKRDSDFDEMTSSFTLVVGKVQNVSITAS